MLYIMCDCLVLSFLFFFLMIRRPPRSTLFLHDALPIFPSLPKPPPPPFDQLGADLRRLLLLGPVAAEEVRDRKSTRLNSSHSQISYAVFCLKKKSSGTGGFSSLLSPHLRISQNTFLRSV